MIFVLIYILTKTVNHGFQEVILYVKRMFVKVFAPMFLFIIQLCFPRSRSIAIVIRIRYSDKFRKNVRKFETSDYQIRKCQLDI